MFASAWKGQKESQLYWVILSGLTTVLRRGLPRPTQTSGVQVVHPPRVSYTLVYVKAHDRSLTEQIDDDLSYIHPYLWAPFTHAIPPRVCLAQARFTG
jgi:hypothetical protein